MKHIYKFPMIEYSIILDKALTIAGGALGVKVFEHYISKRKAKKEVKEKEDFIGSLKEISLMNHFMADVIDNTDADRFLVLVGHDSGNIPNPKHPYYAKAMWQKVASSVEDENLIRKYDSVRVDFDYINMIIEIISKGCVKIEVDNMNDCFLKRIYQSENIKYSEIYFLAQERGHKIYYCSIATGKNSRFEDHNQRMKIELAVNHLRQIFEKI